jgi:hypothetical protein
MSIRGRRVVVEGRVQEEDSIETGPPLLLSRYEWRSRYKNYLMWDLVYTLLVPIILLLVVGSVLYTMLSDRGLVAIFVGITLLIIMVTNANLRSLFESGTPPGLYEGGLMHTKMFFIPYAELEGVAVTRTAIPILPDIVTFQPMFERPTEDYSEWDLPLRVIGDDGVELLRERIAAATEGIVD